MMFLCCKRDLSYVAKQLKRTQQLMLTGTIPNGVVVGQPNLGAASPQRKKIMPSARIERAILSFADWEVILVIRFTTKPRGRFQAVPTLLD